MIYLYVAVMLIISVSSAQNTDTSHIRVFPGMNQSVAGVFHVSSLDHLHQPQYAFAATEARTLCSSLGVTIASKSQVEEAHSKGFETCRYGWVDENVAIVPRIKPLSHCGRNQTGVVTWRAPVTQAFDVFCFNESDVATLNNSNYSGQTLSPSKTTISTQTTHPTSSSSLHPSSSSVTEILNNKVDSARFINTAQRSAGANVVLITSACVVLLIAIVIIAYLNLRKSCSQSADVMQQQNYTETGEWSCVKSVNETKQDAQEDERIEVGDDAS